MNTADVCQRCFTTHPLNDEGKRPCPKPPTVPLEIGLQIIPPKGFYAHDNRKVTCHADVL